METLKELGHRCGTDKEYHEFAGTTYIDIYEENFKQLRNEKINLLEIGVRTGGSLRAWKGYFMNGNVFGIDIDPTCKQYEEERIVIEIGSQADKLVIDTITARAGGSFDIIIDDGSHVNIFTLSSFSLLFGALKSGGIYVIEDLWNSYLKLDSVYDVRKIWPGMKHNTQDQSLDNDRKVMDELFLKILSDMDHGQGSVKHIQFWSQMCFIYKL